MTSQDALSEHLDRFTHDVLVDAFVDASRAYWERRARQLEAARPRRGDYLGHATPQDLVVAWSRLSEAAAACRARAMSTDVSVAEALEVLQALDATREDDVA